MNIADIFFGAHIDAATLNVEAVKTGRDAGNKGGASLGKALSESFRAQFTAANLGKGIVQGLGLAGGLGIANIVRQFVGVVGDAIEAAKEDEASIRRLDAALKANIPAWDGNTQAIERVIRARMNLGFADEEQRDSLSRLVAATHDVNKALEIERTAMDLARFKGISLADASEALTKVEAGSYRILKSLGIQLGKNATQQDALNAVQAVARGQAEAYADTNEGKLLVSQVKLEEAMERLGYVVLPLVANAMKVVADAATALDAVFGGFKDQTADLADDLHKNLAVASVQSMETMRAAYEKGINDLNHGFASWAPGAKEAREALQVQLDEVNRAIAQTVKDADSNTTSMAGKVADDLVQGRDSVAGSMGAVVTAAAGMQSGIKTATTGIVGPVSNPGTAAWLNSEMAKAAKGLISGYFDPIEIRAQEFELRQEQRSLAQQQRNTKDKNEWRTLGDAISANFRKQADGLVDLSTQGKLTAGDVKMFRDNVKKYYDSLGKDVPPDLQKIIAKLNTLVGFDGKTVDITVLATFLAKNAGIFVPPHRQAGGRQPAGEVGWVGERGPELWVPEQPGYVIDNETSRALARAGLAPAGSSGGDTYNYNVMLPVGPSPEPFETARELSRLGRFGMLSPRPGAGSVSPRTTP